MKNKIVHILLVMIAVMLFSEYSFAAKQKKILVFSKTAAYRHGSAITEGTKAIQQMGKENNFLVDATEDAAKFTSENLKQYDAIVFLCTTGNVLTDDQQKAFEQYIRAGGGFAGIHSACDTEYDWPWYGELVGAYFGDHPPGQQEAVFNIVDPNNISTRHLPVVWKKKDELYNFKWIAPSGLNILITIDENSYNPTATRVPGNGEFHPMSWYHDYDGGRSFFTALGHDNVSMQDPVLLKHILGGIEYAMGAKPQDKLIASTN